MLWPISIHCGGGYLSQPKTNEDYNELLKRCDELIRSGQIAEVGAILGEITLAQVPRTHRQALAKICRRSGLIPFGLRLLQPIIHSEKPLLDPATPGEVCEYAVLLSRNGSIQEALSLLSKVNSSKAPEALLYQGYCNISMWDYANAIGYLEAYLATDLDPYAKLIAGVNLASAYVTTGDLSAAEDLLNKSIDVAKQSGAMRLVGNCLELRGQVHILRHDFSKARTDLDQALSIFGHAQSYDQLLIAKWQALMSATEQGSTLPLSDFRAMAVNRKHWESVREADLFMLRMQFEQARFDHLVYGTSLVAYRNRIHQQLPYDPSSSFVYGTNCSRFFDLTTGTTELGDTLSEGKKIHKVIATLIRDLYVPRNMGTLFAELYPDEYFDVSSSPLRVRQLLSRARRWAEAYDVPISIEQSAGSYRLVITGDYGIRMIYERPAIEPNQVHWQRVKNVFPIGTPFKVGEACEKLGLSKSAFHRLSTWAIENGSLQREGEGKATRYKRAA